MKYFMLALVAVLTFLAVTSGVTKIMLMPQDVEFFGKYGFSNPILMIYGAIQLIGGILIPIKKTRFIGTAIVVLTFLVSLAVLILDGNVPVSIITVIATLLAGFVMVQSRAVRVQE